MHCSHIACLRDGPRSPAGPDTWLVMYSEYVTASDLELGGEPVGIRLMLA